MRKYIEISTVKPALFINSLSVSQLTHDKELLLTELIEQFYKLYRETKIELLLVDRGFFTKNVVKLLIEKNTPFIMPAIKNKSIKKLVEKYKKGEIQNRIKYQFGDKTVNLLFLQIEDDVLVYITNTRKSILQIHILYSKRWQIETNFREQNKFTFKTCSKDFNLRYLAFVLGGLLFNAWQLTKNNLSYILESYMFKKYLIEELLSMWQKISRKEVVKSIDYLLVA